MQVCNEMIRNPDLSSEAFLLFVKLKYDYECKHRNKNNEYNSDVHIFYHRNIMEFLGWKDLRTFKKCLNELHMFGYIECLKDFLPKLNPLEIKIEKIEKNFTSLPHNLLYNIKSIGKYGFRLLYYYESFINRKIKQVHSYPSMEKIYEHTRISDKTVKKYNDILVKLKYLKIEKHELINGFVNENGETTAKRFNNYYYVKLENIKNIKDNKADTVVCRSAH